MNWPVSFLHVVGCEDIGNPGKSVQKSVLKSEHWGRSDDSGLWKNGSCNIFTLGLGPEEFRGRVEARVIRGNVDISVNVILCNRFYDTLCSFNMDILIREVPTPD